MSKAKRSIPRVDYEALQDVCKALLLAIGEDPEREGLKETPRRFADMWQEFIEYQPGRIDTAFDSIRRDQMIVVSGMKVFSLCEHHLLPFWCEVSIGYIADKKVLGLSKFARIAHKHAHRLQIQERLVEMIAEEVGQVTGAADLAVIGRGEHFCMSTRGIRTQGEMKCSVMRGRFKHDAETRAEFLTLAKV